MVRVQICFISVLSVTIFLLFAHTSGNYIPILALEENSVGHHKYSDVSLERPRIPKTNIMKVQQLFADPSVQNVKPGTHY